MSAVAKGKLTVIDGGPPPPPVEKDDRVEVVLHLGRIDQAADAAEKALIEDGAPFYARGEVLVRLGGRGAWHREAKIAADEEQPPLVPATVPMLHDALEACCHFLGYNPKGEVVTRACPKEVSSVILSRVGRWRAPPVRGVASAPVMHADGSMVCAGYDPRSRHVVVAPGEWPVPAAPTESAARAALARVEELIAGFPFVGGADRSVTLAAFLSGLLRPSLRTCPGFAWDAPSKASGKSKLADIVSAIASGRCAKVMTWPASPEEQEKRLGAQLLAGVGHIAIDNIEGALRGDALNSMMTQETMAIRVLGLSSMPSVPIACLLTVTGNNLVVSGDMTRRILVARIDPQMERPELREFAFDPVTKAQSERRELVVALLTVARWWAREGRSVGLPALGSFEEWSRRVRDPLVALGYDDPCSVLEVLQVDDPERMALVELLSEWQKAFGESPTTVAQAISTATGDYGDKGLRGALDAQAGGPGGINARRLGKYLIKQVGRVVDGLVLRRGADSRGGTATWRVERSAGFAGFAGFDSAPIHARARAHAPLTSTKTNPANPANPAEQGGANPDGGEPCPF